MSSSLKLGGTRQRLFKALKQFSKVGLSAKKIKEVTGMAKNSGHLAVVLGEEQETGRIRCEVHDDNGRDVKFYFLTKTGLEDLKDDNVDYKQSGNRIGVAWTKSRRVKNPVKKTVVKKAKSSNNSSKKKTSRKKVTAS
jgi:DNA-binding PadR family transcriptional regulator